MPRRKPIAFVLPLILALCAVSLAGCEKPIPEVPTPTVLVVLSPQAPPPTAQGGPTTVSVLGTPSGGPTNTIVWDVPTFTPTPQAGASPTSGVTSVPATAVPTATTTPGPDGYITHRVEWGDTLYSLARRYGTTVDAIVAANGLANENFIRVGQELKIRQGDQGTTPPTGGTRTYVVQPGDTLYGIALRFGTTVAAIAQANGIVNPAFIRDGTRLTIPTGTSGTPSQSGSIYVVQPGDTLSSIAARFGTTYWAIAMANNLPNANFIRAGQTLIIPGR